MAGSLFDRVKHTADEPPKTSPIVDQALALIHNHDLPIAERVPQIYSLLAQANKAGGADQSRSGLIIDALYANASKAELTYIIEQQSYDRQDVHSDVSQPTKKPIDI